MSRAGSLVMALVVVAAACRGGRKARAVDDGGATLDAAAPPVTLTPAVLDRIAAVTVPDHTVAVLARGERDVALAVRKDDLRVLVTVAPCLACTPIDLAAWQAQRPALAALWAPGAEQLPPAAGAALTIAPIAIGAATAMTLDARRGTAGAAYLAHWNDGVTQAQAVCELAVAPEPTAPSPCAPVAQAALAAVVAALR